jgi:hypothetical protein
MWCFWVCPVQHRGQSLATFRLLFNALLGAPPVPPPPPPTPKANAKGKAKARR